MLLVLPPESGLLKRLTLGACNTSTATATGTAAAWPVLILVHSWPEAWGWGAVTTCLPGAITHNLGVNGAAHTVVKLRIQLGEGIDVVNTRVLDVTDGSSLHDVPDDKLLDGLVLGHASGTVGAADGPYVATPLFAAPVVPALLSHVGWW